MSYYNLLEEPTIQDDEYFLLDAKRRRMNTTTRRYTFEKTDTWQQRVIKTATLFRQRFGVAPTSATIHASHTDAPEQIGVVKIKRGWGPMLLEIDYEITEKEQQP